MFIIALHCVHVCSACFANVVGRSSSAIDQTSEGELPRVALVDASVPSQAMVADEKELVADM